MAKVFVGTYHKYNSGSVAGAWLDCENYNNYDEFLDAAREIHSDEQDPELMFQDFEGFPKEWYSETEIKTALWEWLDLDEQDQKIVTAYLKGVDDCDDVIEKAKDCFVGTYDTAAEFAQQWAEDYGEGEIPSWIVIDWDATWECNLRHDYDAVRYDGDLYIFRKD